MKTKIYQCKHCGNVVVKTIDSGVKVECCGEPMEEVAVHTFEGGVEKHLPVVTWEPSHLHIEVGSVLHPMSPEHHISFLVIEWENRIEIVWLEGQPKADVCTSCQRPKAIYAFCNIHGLWKKDC